MDRCRSTVVFITQNHIVTGSSTPTRFHVTFRETIKNIKKYTIESLMIDGNGFTGPTNMYFIQGDVVGTSRQSLIGSTTSQAILPFVSSPNVITQIYLPDNTPVETDHSDGLLQDLYIWITDISGNGVFFNSNNKFCLQLRVWQNE